MINKSSQKIAVAVCVTAFLALTALFVAAFNGIRINYLSILGIRYVTDADFSKCKSYKNDDGWFIIPRYNKIKDPSPLCIRLSHNNPDSQRLEDRFDYYVFDSSNEAQTYFDNLYGTCTKHLTDDKKLDEGRNWFIARNPNVCDAVITSMFYLEDNVVIICNFPNKPTDLSPEILQPMTASHFIPTSENLLLKEYVINNAPSLADYSISNILCNEYDTLYKYSFLKHLFYTLVTRFA
ncbi:MAG: hypothetical protein MJ153_01710 [Clostridia bacterium]|nr:hypothetical protein [Clostridia bacterium]